MDCGYVHFAIEKAVSGSEMFVPIDYQWKIESLHVKGEPYKVKYVKYSFL